MTIILRRSLPCVLTEIGECARIRVGISHMSCLGPYKQTLEKQDLDHKGEKYDQHIMPLREAQFINPEYCYDVGIVRL